MQQDWKTFGRYGTLGLEFALSVLFGLAVGHWLDKKFGAGGWITVLGFGFGLAYTPGASREEVFRLFALGRERGVTSFVHMRGAGLSESGGTLDALQEMIAGAATTGASVHVIHIGSMALRQTPVALEMIAGAQRQGLDVSTEVYPYTAASTSIRP